MTGPLTGLLFLTALTMLATLMHVRRLLGKQQGEISDLRDSLDELKRSRPAGTEGADAAGPSHMPRQSPPLPPAESGLPLDM